MLHEPKKPDTHMIANLMMYERPQLKGAHARYWQLIRDNLHLNGIESPEQLSQETEEFLVWKSPALVLSQTCGMPYRIWLHNLVKLVGTPDYNLEGCAPGYYRSALVVRASDPRKSVNEFRDAVFVYNQTFSQSGYAAPFNHLKQYGFWFEQLLHSGQHLKSAHAVADNHADIASLDAASWRLMLQHDTFTSQLRVLEWTEPTPGLPLITSQSNDALTIYHAVSSAIDQLDEDDRKLLGLRGIVKIPGKLYTAIPNPPF